MLLYFYPEPIEGMKRFFEFLFGREKRLLEETDSMKKYLLIGLGNIGEEYADTRHNVGFQVLNKLSEKQKFSFETRKLGDLGSFKNKRQKYFMFKTIYLYEPMW